jgi:hypothetical protein
MSCRGHCSQINHTPCLHSRQSASYRSLDRDYDSSGFGVRTVWTPSLARVFSSVATLPRTYAYAIVSLCLPTCKSYPLDWVDGRYVENSRTNRPDGGRCMSRTCLREGQRFFTTDRSTGLWPTHARCNSCFHRLSG